MADKALVDQIVAGKHFGEDKRAWLEQLADDQLKPIAAHVAGETEPEPAKEPVKEPEPVAAAAAEKPATEEEWLKLAPSEETREMVAQMRREFDARTDTLVTEIVSHAGKLFTEEELRSKKRPELEKIHALATKPAPDFSGRGVAAHDASAGKKTERRIAPMPGITVGSAA